MMRKWNLSVILTVLLSISVYQVEARRLFKSRKLQEEGEPGVVSFLVTYRDFLPSSCMYITNNDDLIAENVEAWNNDRQITTRNTCDLYKNVSILEQALDEGLIVGHPDMNANNQKVSQNEICDDSGLLPIASCRFEDGQPLNQAMLNLTDFVDKSGIPKPAYCKSDPEGRCGFIGEENVQVSIANKLVETQTSKKFFDLWFEDNLAYNKRIGQRLDLKQQTLANGSLSNSFNFSNADSDDPEREDLSEDFFGPLGRFKISGDDVVDINDFQDPRDAPAWPKAFDGDKGFWMTTELHTTFQFFSGQDMVFTFSGDDDFWAFINGQLAIDLQGTHGVLTASIDLNAVIPGRIDLPGSGGLVSDLLGLVDGEIYTLDIYHAERNVQGSNFAITSNLFPACNVQQSGTIAIDFASGISESEFESDFVKSSSVKRRDENSFQISSAENPFGASFIFSALTENVGRGFIATFNVELTGETDGFAFVIQNRGTDDYPISSGPNFNILGVTNSFAVVFDFCANRGDVDFTECLDQQVRIHHQETAEEENNASEETIIVLDDIVKTRNNRFNDFKVEIIFFESPDFLEVYIDDSLYLRESGFDIETILASLGGFVGFTSSSAEKAADIFISNFVLTTVEVDATNTVEIEIPVFVNGTEVNETGPIELLADGTETAGGISFQTFDNCGNKIDTGTLEGFGKAVFVGFALVEEVEEGEGRFLQNETFELVTENGKIQDNNDGSYTALLSTERVANFSVFITFGEDCDIEVNEDGFANFSGVNCFVANATDVISSTPVIVDEIELDEAEEADNDVLTLILASSGGGVCCIALLGVLLFAFYRNKWKKNQKYVKPGAEYKIEANTNFSVNSEHKATASALLASQQEILKLQTLQANDARTDEIDRLKNENEQMKEVIITNKKNDQMNVSGQPAGTYTTKKNKKKMDF